MTLTLATRKTHAPYLVACLVQLRTEFNAIEPGRDTGADGWIGNAAHRAEVSDHNPDALGRVLALDVDSTGPWSDAQFVDFINWVVGRQRAGLDHRLEYVIWDRHIASRSSGWRWDSYTATSDPHTGHAHFSARHDHTGDDDTTPFYLEEAMLTDTTIAKIAAAAASAVWATAGGSAGTRETAFERLGHVDQAVDQINGKLDELAKPLPE